MNDHYIRVFLSINAAFKQQLFFDSKSKHTIWCYRYLFRWWINRDTFVITCYINWSTHSSHCHVSNFGCTHTFLDSPFYFIIILSARMFSSQFNWSKWLRYCNSDTSLWHLTLIWWCIYLKWINLQGYWLHWWISHTNSYTGLQQHAFQCTPNKSITE